MTAHAHQRTGPCTIEAAPYDDADVRQLLAEFQAAQMALYGFADDPSATPPDDYTAPNGLFLLARTTNREPAGCGGWRRLDEQTAEIKRMYLRPAFRGLSLGRRILRLLEVDARAQGLHVAQLETGVENRAALALYHCEGYHPIPPYRPGRDPSINRALRKQL
ncbi:GNAT family N-acetyltransferase [Streptomyces achromogenes]|uniref:GNAT family N-acetyltransferase n=1 Tax=Streptomyces achromogenes TaxID=67255 RepID=UPI0033DF2204